MPRLEPETAGRPATIVSDRPMSENKTGNWRSLRPVIHAEACTGCLICWKYCPDACVTRTEKAPVVELDYCKGCGICAAECPAKCVELVAEAG